MIIYEFASEKHLVDEFIKYTHSNKLNLSYGKQVHLFVWGYEMWLPEGGKLGYNGSIDLIGTDELGNVWLIEAKQSANPELNKAIWNNQILNYRKALSRRTHDEISLKSRRYLLRLGNSDTVPNYIGEECNSLYDAFCDWARFLGKEEQDAILLYNQTLEKINKEEVISVVLADVYRQNIYNHKPKDDKSYAYIVIKGTEINCEVEVIQDINFSAETLDYNGYEKMVKKWAELTKEKQKVKPKPASVELYLSNKVVHFYKECISYLESLGWHNNYKSNQKAFVVDLPTKYSVPIRIHLGWVDFDGSFSIKNRLPGEMGLKFNIDFRHFKKSLDPEVQEIGYQLAKRLAKEARYNGRAAGLNIQKRELTDIEKKTWDWEMYRRIDRENRDYLGNEDEKADFAAAWLFLKEIVQK